MHRTMKAARDTLRVAVRIAGRRGSVLVLVDSPSGHTLRSVGVLRYAIRRLPTPPSVREIAVLAAVGTVSLALLVAFQSGTGVGGDWYRWFEALPAQLADGQLYEEGYGWRWSPVAAWLFAGVLLPLGPLIWAALHIAAVALLARADRWLMWLTLFAWPFWVDLIVGNAFTFVAVAGMFAVRGSRTGALVYLALTLLMPRPVQVPVAVWLLWQRPDVRVPFAAMFAAHGVAVIASGYLGPWIAKLLSSTDEVELAANIAPSALVGWLWPAVGIPLGIWLTWKGRVGLASLAVSPYWLPQYLLMLLLKVRQGSR